MMHRFPVPVCESYTMSDNPTAKTVFPGADSAPRLETAAVAVLLNQGRLPPRFSVIRELYRGHVTQVFLIRDDELQRDLVAKLAETDDALVAPVRYEHAHIPPIYDSGVQDGIRWTLQRYVPGRSLEHVLRERTWSVTESLQLVATIADSLAAAHARGIVHLDVKPANILIGEHGDCALIDWNAACESGARPREGTPGYMPSEQERGAACDVRADVHALGATLLHLLSGYRPDRLPTDWRWPRSRRIRSSAAVIVKAMAVMPEARYDSIEAFAADCRRCLAGEAPSVRPDPFWLIVWLLIRRRPFGTAAVITALVASLLLAGFLFRYQQERKRDWQTVVWETFDQPLQAEHWQGWALPMWRQEMAEALPLVHPCWRVDAGGLQVSTPTPWLGCVNLTRSGFSATDVRISWVVTPLRTTYNLNAYLGRRRDQLYTVHIGGYGQDDLVLLSGPPEQTTLAVARLPQAITVGTSYHLQLTCRIDAIELVIDSRPVLSYPRPSGYAPDHIDAFGLECSRNELTIDDLRIERLQLPQVLERQQVADLLEARGYHASALDLLAECPDIPRVRWARIRCLQALGRQSQLERALQTLVQSSDDPGRAHLAMADFRLRQQAYRRAEELLERIEKSAKVDRQVLLRVLDIILDHQYRQDLDVRDVRTFPAAVHAYAERWRKWLRRWDFDISDWDWFRLPQRLRKNTADLVDMLAHDLIRQELANLHPGLMAGVFQQAGQLDRLQAPHLHNQAAVSVSHPAERQQASQQWQLPVVPSDFHLIERELQRIVSGRERVVIQTRALSHSEYRREISARLMRAVTVGDTSEIERILELSRWAALGQQLLREELVFPLAVLLALQRPDDARDYFQAIDARYSHYHVPGWRRLIEALVAGDTVSASDLEAVETLRPSYPIPLTLLQAMAADARSDLEQARRCYAACDLDTTPWAEFIAWRLMR
jgi:hypothetical protein